MAAVMRQTWPTAELLVSKYKAVPFDVARLRLPGEPIRRLLRCKAHLCSAPQRRSKSQADLPNANLKLRGKGCAAGDQQQQRRTTALARTEASSTARYVIDITISVDSFQELSSVWLNVKRALGALRYNSRFV
jgi:hypothetical protein